MATMPLANRRAEGSQIRHGSPLKTFGTNEELTSPHRTRVSHGPLPGTSSVGVGGWVGGWVDGWVGWWVVVGERHGAAVIESLGPCNRLDLVSFRGSDLTGNGYCSHSQ